MLTTRLPAGRTAPTAESRWRQITFGTRRYLSTRPLRGLLALNLAVAAASAMVIVNTVVYVRDGFAGDAGAVALALGVSGAGAMLAALLLPRVLDRVPDRAVMLGGGLLLAVGLAFATVVESLHALLGVWFALGLGLSLVQTPIGRIVTRSGSPEQRPALFAAQFSLSHACWLATYPIAGVLGSMLGLAATASILAGIAAAAVLVAGLAWRADAVASTGRPRTAVARVGRPA